MAKKKCPCLNCLTVHSGPPKKWLLNLPNRKMVLQGFCFMKESDRHSAGHKRQWLITASIGGIVLKIPCFMEKSAGHYGPVGIRWVPPALRKNFGWLSRQWYDSVNSRVLKVAYNALPLYLDNIIAFWNLWWSWRIDSYNYSFP